jgi:glycerate kinase
MKNILVAPNAFKNSLGAEEAAACIQRGILRSLPACQCTLFPIGDGGDGTGHLITSHQKGQKVSAIAHDPLGRQIETSYGLIDQGKTAVIEMADASGIRLLSPDRLDPLHANSLGTGDLIRQALDQGVKRILITLGGSATVDGGTGILCALGVKFKDALGNELNNLPADLDKLRTIDLTEIDQRLASCELIVLCDVENPLLGETGSASVFGPQKGAVPQQVHHLEKCLTRLSGAIQSKTGKEVSQIKYGGSAGGVAAGLHGILNATLVNGLDYFLIQTGFDDALKGSDLVITGEGRIDSQTLQGKGPFGIAQRAKKAAVPVIGLAGSIPLKDMASLHTYFDALLPINYELTDLNTAFSNTADNLSHIAEAVGHIIHSCERSAH